MNSQTTLQSFSNPANLVSDKLRFEEMPVETINEITKLYMNILYRTHDRQCFEKSLKVFLSVLGSWKNDNEYLDLIKDLDKQTVTDFSKIFGLLLKHFCYDENFTDILGPVYSSIGKNNEDLGQFFIPWHVAYMMASCSGVAGKKIMDPCCGSGVLLLAAKAVIVAEKGQEALTEYSFHGVDIDSICADMCKIQMLFTDAFYMTNFLIIKYGEIKNSFDKKGEK